MSDIVGQASWLFLSGLMWLSCLVIPLQAALALADEGSVKKGPTRKEVAKAGKGEEGGEQEEGVEDELKGEEEEELYKDLMQQLFEEEEDRDGLEEEGKGKRPRRPRAEGEAEAEAEAEVEVEVEPEQRERRPAQRKARKRRRIEQDDDEDEEAEEEKKRERVKSRGQEEDDMEQYIRSEEEVAKLSRVWVRCVCPNSNRFVIPVSVLTQTGRSASLSLASALLVCQSVPTTG